jgi:hypothetical protein
VRRNHVFTIDESKNISAPRRANDRRALPRPLLGPSRDFRHVHVWYSRTCYSPSSCPPPPPPTRGTLDRPLRRGDKANLERHASFALATSLAFPYASHGAARLNNPVESSRVTCRRCPPPRALDPRRTERIRAPGGGRRPSHHPTPGLIDGSHWSRAHGGVIITRKGR